MSPSLAIGTLVLECRAGCRSPFMWVFLHRFCWGRLRGHCCSCVTLLAIALMDVVGFVVELMSSKRICSICWIWFPSFWHSLLDHLGACLGSSLFLRRQCKVFMSEVMDTC